LRKELLFLFLFGSEKRENFYSKILEGCFAKQVTISLRTTTSSSADDFTFSSKNHLFFKASILIKVVSSSSTSPNRFLMAASFFTNSFDLQDHLPDKTTRTLWKLNERAQLNYRPNFPC
jgi:hypothetical protein